MFGSLKTPVIIGHRGASKYAPENTLAAFKLAVDQAAPAIELDVKLSADGHVVVIHDQSVARTSDGRGSVARLSLAELKKLDAGSWFSPMFTGEKIPTLEDVFDTVGHQVLMNIELTNYATPNDRLVHKVVELVKIYGIENRVYFSSFFSTNLDRVRKLLPDCGIGYLAYDGLPRFLQRIIQPLPRAVDSLNPSRGTVTERMVSRAHGLGRRVLVYTVNDKDEMRHLFNIGVDGIFTDDPLTGNLIAAEYGR
jgi:glycerophosphoryl diester phosphodiesterase